MTVRGPDGGRVFRCRSPVAVRVHCRRSRSQWCRCLHPSRGVGVVLSSTISAGRLRPLRGFHVRSIDHVFCMGSSGTEVPWNPYLGGGFPLRCFQRLSHPNVANRPCRWRDNRHTRGSSTQVLSYYGQGSSRFQRAQRIETKLSHDVLNPARVPL